MHLFFKSRPARDFAHLLTLVPDTEFPHLTRSTIPLLSYWRACERSAATALAGVLGRVDAPLGDLHFEHETPAYGGNSPSCTDVMYLSTSTAFAIEGKWKEPLYGTAADWLRKGTNRQNRENVLGHWADLIHARTGVADRSRMAEVEYQMLHRTSSACATGRDSVAVVFQMFGASSVPEPYSAALRRITEVVGGMGAIKIYAHCVPMTLTDRYSTLCREIGQMDDQTRVACIRDAISQGVLFDFGEGTFVPFSE